MYRKLSAIVLCFLFIPCLFLSAFAQTASYIHDDAKILLPEEISVLEEKAADLSALYNIDPVILTVHSLGGQSAQNCADLFYDSTGFKDNGVLLLLAMEEREWYISTAGNAIYALTDYGVQQLGEDIIPFLAEGNWYDSFYQFLESLPVYLDAYLSGSPIDGTADYSGNYYHGNQDDVIYYAEKKEPSFLLSLGIGLLVAGISIFLMRYCMNSKRPQRSASEYMEEGSWSLLQSRDLYLYSNVTKTRRQQSKSNSGGSSVHRSSGGRSHGGGGGKF